MKKIYILILLVVGGFLFYELQATIKPILSDTSSPNVTINNKKIKVELANDYDKWQKGLSDREELDKDTGMLFVFPGTQIRNFWMKNMHFPIDIIWIEHNKVIGISKNLQPEGEMPTNSYSSILPVNYVLEVNAGFADKNNIKEGDLVEYEFQK